MNNIFKEAVQQTMHQLEQGNKKILNRVMGYLKNDQVHNRTIKLQRLYYILKLPPAKRSEEQIKLLQSHFEDKFKYVQKFKDSLDEEMYGQFFTELSFEEIQPLQTIFKFGDPGRRMYFILDGEVCILLPTGKEETPQDKNKFILRTEATCVEDVLKLHFPTFRIVYTKTEGDQFGEVAIEQKVPRTATIITKTACHLASITYESYQRILGAYKDKVVQTNLAFIRTIPIFQRWTRQGHMALLHACMEEQIPTGNYLFRYSQKCSHVYIVIQGEFLVEYWENKGSSRFGDNMDKLFSNQNYQRKILGVFGSGQMVGDFELANPNDIPQVRRSQAQARVDSKVFRINLQQFLDLVRVFSKMDEFKLYCQAKLKFSQEVHQKQVIVQQTPKSQERPKLDLFDIGQQLVDFQRTQYNKNKLSIKKRRDEDPESEYMKLQANKYSFTIPFRENPYNKEVEVVKQVSPKERPSKRSSTIQAHRQSRSPSEEEHCFSPKCSVLSIFSGGQLKPDRRILTARKQKQSTLHFLSSGNLLSAQSKKLLSIHSDAELNSFTNMKLSIINTLPASRKTSIVQQNTQQKNRVHAKSQTENQNFYSTVNKIFKRGGGQKYKFEVMK